MIKKIMKNNYTTNSYLIGEGESAILIDPVGKAGEFSRLLEEEGLKLKGIILTHGHYDHIASLNDLMDEFDVKVYIHKEDEKMLFKSELNLSIFFGEDYSYQYPYNVEEVKEGIEYVFGEIKLEILHTPGHTPGSICIRYGGHLFTGDTLFCGSMGRTDFPGGDLNVMMESLGKIKKLDDRLMIYPGHGETSSIRSELDLNPYLNQ
ncbi:MAG: MBL fold metallo-hydrolase [Eubacteriaceae bacterium]|nr:MBL fold metallo-hydrolase [Eubacteriaceae bacterium]